MMKIFKSSFDLIQQAKNELKMISKNPFQESIWILNSVIKQTPFDIYFQEGKKIEEEESKEFLNRIKKRKQGFPLSYLLQEKEFFRRNFYVKEGVFIPRPETEEIVKWVLNYFNDAIVRGIDFGTGSGCLAISLIKEMENVIFISVDFSKEALFCVKENVKRFQIVDSIQIIEKDVSLLDKKDLEFLKGKTNLIVANPPYISFQDSSLENNVRNFEPHLALFSKQEGMAHIYSWFHKAMNLLDPRGIYIFEFGFNQEEKINYFLSKQDILEKYQIIKDENNIDRIAVCFKKNF